jgi:hypothetical protein
MSVLRRTNGVTSQSTALFIVIAMKTSNLVHMLVSEQEGSFININQRWQFQCVTSTEDRSRGLATRNKLRVRKIQVAVSGRMSDPE